MYLRGQAPHCLTLWVTVVTRQFLEENFTRISFRNVPYVLGTDVPVRASPNTAASTSSTTGPAERAKHAWADRLAGSARAPDFQGRRERVVGFGRCDPEDSERRYGPSDETRSQAAVDQSRRRGEV